MVGLDLEGLFHPSLFCNPTTVSTVAVLGRGSCALGERTPVMTNLSHGPVCHPDRVPLELLALVELAGIAARLRRLLGRV